MRKILLLGGIFLSAVLIWFTTSNYLSARPIAEENLNGLALSLTSAIENIALHDPSLRNLDTFKSHDIAFFALINREGVYRFHTNQDLIGSSIQGNLPLSILQDGATSYERISLRTGETAFEFNAPIHLPGETLALRLTLHTYRADTVIRRAKLNMIVLFSLLAAGWILSLTLYRFTLREEQRKLDMAHRESLARLGEMSAMLAHEIRNPLAGIKGYAQIIGKKPQDDRNDGFAQLIVEESQRLETLVNDLLAFARSNEIAMITVDLCEVLAYCAALLQHEAEELNVKIICNFANAILINGSRDRISQVLLNLGKNAIQAMPDGGSLRITASVVGKKVIICVSDDGQGISQEDLSRIFEPFYTTKAKGTGLGLALCKKIVEEHKGKITVHSAVGQGTSVSITIPIQ
jgi:two-component system sensor histidine kinase HydH